MEIKRTANAGVLLKLDGISILLDGVCEEVWPYLATTSKLRSQLAAEPPQLIAITHKHMDHYDAAFVSDYLQNTAGPVLGPADIPLCTEAPLQLGAVSITPVRTRHLGKPDPATEHRSYVLQGTSCIWFVGDAAPVCFKGEHGLPMPDVLIAPYAYGIAGGWETVKQLKPKAVILLHLPNRECDPAGLWEHVEMSVGKDRTIPVYIPQIGQTIRFL